MRTAQHGNGGHGPRGLSRQWLTRLLVCGLLVFIGACADPGTGGSGVPTASVQTGTDPAAGSQGGVPTAGITAPALQKMTGIIESVSYSADGQSAGASTAASGQQVPAGLVVNGTRFALADASITGADGSARPATDLQAGVRVTISYSPQSDLQAAAVTASGPAVAAVSVQIELPGG